MSNPIKANDITHKVAQTLVQWRWLFMIASLLIVIVLASGGRFIGFATDYEAWFSDDNPQLRDFLKLQKVYNKSDNVVFLLTPKSGDVFTPKTLSSVSWLTEQAWQTPYSTRVDSLTNFQYSYANEDDLIVADLVQNAENLTSSELAKIKHIALNEPLLLHRAISADAAYQMIGGVAFALALISLLIVISLRSVKIGLVSLIPNLVPPVMAFGVWGLLVGEVGFALAVGLGMTIGIIVDDTVHFLSKYLRARREKGLTAEDAVRYAFDHVGTALLITTAVLVAGFSVLLLSTFKLNAELGMITALTIGLALILDFLLLP